MFLAGFPCPEQHLAQRRLSASLCWMTMNETREVKSVEESVRAWVPEPKLVRSPPRCSIFIHQASHSICMSAHHTPGTTCWRCQKQDAVMSRTGKIHASQTAYIPAEQLNSTEVNLQVMTYAIKKK